MALPELSDGPADLKLIAVEIKDEAIPEVLPGAVRLDEVCTVSATEYLLTIEGVGRFYVAHGREVRVEAEAGVPSENMRVYLLGSVFGALCHQNGLLPLHASAVQSGGEVTAFLGDSGAGKSTLAAFLGRRGFEITADDICLLDLREEGAAMRVIPVASWLKLWKPSLEALDVAGAEENRVYSKQDKYRIYLGDDVPARGLPLKRLVFLERGEEGEAISLVELVGSEAVPKLMEMTYLDYVPLAVGGEVGLFLHCGRVVGEARCFRLRAPWGWDAMERVVEFVDGVLRQDERLKGSLPA